MSDDIKVLGIETNNLKKIDVTLKKHSINLVIGPSGSGKSSLAYDTIAQIGQHELTSMFADETSEPTYKVQAYDNMVASVPIKQMNNNNNIRSTIGTYFGINRNAALIFSVALNMNEDLFVLNKAENLCVQCHGLGYFRELDVNRIINYDIPLENCPVKCWTQYRDFYSQIITQFCIEQGIDYKKNFRMLNEKEKHTILYGESDTKYSIRYKKRGMTSRRTTKYFGILTGEAMIPRFVPAKRFFTDSLCESCNGQKYSLKHREYRLRELSIGEFMCTPFDTLHQWLESISLDASHLNLELAVSGVLRFIQKAVELDLGHLFFNRAIPTLSGGELQRLRLVQVFNTQLTDLLVILDEPLAGLHGIDKLTVYNNIVQMAKKHTMLIVDHHETFLSKAQTIISLGKGSGINGGSLINTNEYLKSQKIDVFHKPIEIKEKLKVSVDSTVYKYDGAELVIAKNGLNVLIGKSGVGKSTLLREYLPQYFDKYTYINQKPLLGNKNSTVATLLDIFRYITESFSRTFDKDKRFFSNLTGCDGACPYCFGSGHQDYGTDYQLKIKIECPECEGTGFNANLKKYRIDSYNIIDIWKMTIDEAYEFYEDRNDKIASVLMSANEVLLGHLHIGQTTSSLSGGENIRIKILKSINSSATIFGIDEPFRGLGRTEIFAMIQYLEKLVRKNKTIIVADHNEESFRYFSMRILLTNQDNKLFGVDYDVSV